MPSLETLRSDIKMIHELSEISEVLEQVAAKSIMKTRDGILKRRDFFAEAWKIFSVLRDLTPISPEVNNKDLVIAITINRGMCGNLLNRVINKAEKLYKEKEADFLITGRKGQGRFMNKDERTIHFFNVPNDVTYDQIEPLKNIVSKYARVHFVFPRFYSISNQGVEVVSLVNGLDRTQEVARKEENIIYSKRFFIEPSVEEVIEYLNQTIVGVLFLNYFSESMLAYNAAQMVAMRNAHDNAEDELKALTLRFQKAKRENIDAKLRDLYKFKFINK